MTWFPIGPDFVNTPRDLIVANRLSRRNEYPRQTMVKALAVDPLPSGTHYTVYTVETPNQGGSGAWRTDDSGNSWISIIDGLQNADPNVDATCIAVNPVNNNYVFLGTQNGAVFVSGTRGASWGPPTAPGGGGLNLSTGISDPRRSARRRHTRVDSALRRDPARPIPLGRRRRDLGGDARARWNNHLHLCLHPGRGHGTFLRRRLARRRLSQPW